jgi:hypothetical protein
MQGSALREPAADGRAGVPLVVQRASTRLVGCRRGDYRSCGEGALPSWVPAARPEEARGRRLSWLALAPGKRKRRPARGDERARTLAVRDTCSGVSALIARCYGNRGAC